jgi:ABC-type dipeptide/oligopeptide/nickel transport system permease component
VTRFLLRRIAQAALTIIVAVTLVFVAVRVIPGSPLRSRFGQHPNQAQIEALEKKYGWDRPIYVQLGDFFWQLVTTGDFGKSLARTNVDVNAELRQRIPATVELTLTACLLAIPLGVAAGTLSAVFRGRWTDRAVSILALLGLSVPVFFLGLVLRSVFTGLPTSQRLPPVAFFQFEPITDLYLVDTLLRGRFDLFWTAAEHLLLPALALSTIPAAIVARITRGSVLETLSADYIRTAKAKGASFLRIILRHALPNAAVPITNIAGLQIGLLLSGAVLTETVFDWPGLGQYLAAAVIRDKDYVAIQAAAIVIATMFVSLNLLLDLLFVWLDPRIRLD